MNTLLHSFYALHLLLSMALIGTSALNCVIGIKPFCPLPHWRYSAMAFALLSQLCLGTYLVYSRGYNAHVPWTQGAYTLVTINLILTLYLARISKPSRKAQGILDGLILALLLLTAFEAASRSNAWMPSL
jgi:hypothetical protein